MASEPRIGTRMWLVGVRDKFGRNEFQFCDLTGRYRDMRELLRARDKGYIYPTGKGKTAGSGNVIIWKITLLGLKRWKDDGEFHKKESGISETGTDT